MFQSYLRPVRYVRHLFWPLALPFMAVTAFRNLMFDLGLLRSKTFPVPIICVGNLEVGGSGKSPLVLHIAKTLRSHRLQVAILSRGYGRSGSGFLLVSEGSTAQEVGDEPLQAKLRLPDVMVAVCADRQVGITRLMQLDSPPHVIVMDDGFQHRWVRPSFSVVTTPASLPFWCNFHLPVGTLRESSSGSKRADALVITGCEDLLDPDFFHGPVFHVGHSAGQPVHFSGSVAELAPSDKIVLLSGIARPERFYNSANGTYSVLAHERYPDHHMFTHADMLRLRDVFHRFGPDTKAVLITEKDAARLRHSAYLNCLENIPVYVLPIGLVWESDDEKRFNQLILSNAGADKGDR